jgi:hypothetical protein
MLSTIGNFAMSHLGSAATFVGGLVARHYAPTLWAMLKAKVKAMFSKVEKKL